MIFNTDKDNIWKGSKTPLHKALNPLYREDTHAIEDKYHYDPRKSSLVDPGTCGENEAIKLIDGEWEIIDDRVGQYYYQKDGVKVQITEYGIDVPEGCIQTDPETIYHKTHNGTAWVANYDRAVKTLKEEKLNEIKTNANAVLEPHVSLYCQPERDSWVVQLEEAKAYDNDKTAETPFIDGMVSAGANKENLIAAILQNKIQFDDILSKVLGQRVVNSDKIKEIYNNTNLNNQEKIDQIEQLNIDIIL